MSHTKHADRVTHRHGATPIKQNGDLPPVDEVIRDVAGEEPPRAKGFAAAARARDAAKRSEDQPVMDRSGRW